MDLKPLGTTPLLVSPIGFGAFKIGRNEGIKYPTGYNLPSDAEVARLLNGVIDLGINLIDTAPAYGTSEQRIGSAISHRREEFVLSSKVGEQFENGRSSYDFSRDAVLSSVAESLRRLKTDHLDIVLIHSDGRDTAIMDETDVVAALQSRKERGDVLAIGLSAKTESGALRALEWADVIMIEYNLDAPDGRSIIAADAAGVGVLVKKGLGSGLLAAKRSIEFVLSNPCVDSMVIGGLDLGHIEANVRTAESVRGTLQGSE